MSLTTSLLVWYDEHARILPWRSDPTPYHVLLSELMLQQTRVETVIPYFERFTARWPTLAAFADADEDEIVEAWAGLGYYRRARNLHKAALEATRRGGLPADVDALRSLPGIGPYTAGAIGSIAFGIATPVVDGNVERVLSRLDGLDADPRSPDGRRALWGRAADLVPEHRPGDFNQAVMELGATVCTPKKPRCGDCPWRGSCVAYAAGNQSELPRRAKKAQPKPIFGVCAHVRRSGRLLVAKRPATGLLAGLWEPPMVEIEAGAARGEALAHSVAQRLGVTLEVRRHLGDVVHVFTHRRLSLAVLDAAVVGDPTALDHYSGVRWIDPVDLDDQGLSTLARKAIAAGEAGWRAPSLLAAEPSRPR